MSEEAAVRLGEAMYRQFFPVWLCAFCQESNMTLEWSDGGLPD